MRWPGPFVEGVEKEGREERALGCEEGAEQVLGRMGHLVARALGQNEIEIRKKNDFENEINTILKIKDLAAKIKQFSGKHQIF